MKFHEKLSALADARRFSKRQLAFEVTRILEGEGRKGLSDMSVGRFLNGSRVPDFFETRALARALGVSLFYLADDSLEEPPPSEESEWERRIKDAVRELGVEEAYKSLMIRAATLADVRRHVEAGGGWLVQEEKFLDNVIGDLEAKRAGIIKDRASVASRGGDEVEEGYIRDGWQILAGEAEGDHKNYSAKFVRLFQDEGSVRTDDKIRIQQKLNKLLRLATDIRREWEAVRPPAPDEGKKSRKKARS